MWMENFHDEQRFLGEEQFKSCCDFAKTGDLISMESLFDSVSVKQGDQPTHVDILSPSKRKKSSPLVFAAKYGHLRIVEYLIHKFPSQAFIDLPCTVSQMIANSGDDLEDVLHNCTALNAASVCGHVDVVRCLLQAGASHSIADCTGATPFIEAVYHGRYTVVKVLKEFNADVNAVNSSGWSAFLIATKKCNLKILRYLLEIGVDVSQKTPEGFGVMLIAVETGAVVAKFLLKHGLSPEFSEGDPNSENYVPCPLYLSALHLLTHKSLFKMLSERPDCPDRCLSDALLLRGVHMLSKATQQDVYDVWSTALHLREDRKIEVTMLPLCDAYGGLTELIDNRALKETCDPSIPNSYIEMLYQALIMLERCIGGSLQIVYEKMIYFAQELYKLGLSHEPEAVLVRALELVEVHNLPMLQKGHCPPQNYEMFYSELVKRVLRILWDNYNEKKPCPCVGSILLLIFNVLVSLIEQSEAVHIKYGCLKWSPRVLLQLTIKIFSDWLPLILHRGEHSLEEKWDVLGRTFVEQFLFQPDGSTLLHVALDAPHVCNAQVFGFLLKWGAKDAINEPYDGKRCLRKATTSSLRSVFDVLINHGAHLDAVDQSGRTALDECPTLVQKYGPFPLACLSARVIVKGGVPYKCLLCIPPRVKTFIGMHDAQVLL